MLNLTQVMIILFVIFIVPILAFVLGFIITLIMEFFYQLGGLLMPKTKLEKELFHIKYYEKNQTYKRL